MENPVIVNLTTGEKKPLPYIDQVEKKRKVKKIATDAL